MSYLLFLDESGRGRESPYDVLAGAAVHDTQLWDLICDIGDAEVEYFGRRISGDGAELKARELLKRKTFRLAEQMQPIPPPERTVLAASLLAEPAAPTRAGLTALAQAKTGYVARVLELCATHGVRIFASIVTPGASKPMGRMLRKDYSFLFERFFYYVDGQLEHERGLVVFDELDRTQARLLSAQMSAYFRQTRTGRMRAGRIIPEPFFVHSDLTTGVQIADLVAYIIAWNVRVSGMRAPRRAELDALGQAVLHLRHRAIVDRPGYPDGFSVWSFALIDDLRPRDERELGNA